MKPITLIFMGLLSFLYGCVFSDDTHPDIPLLPQLDNATIRVDSLANTTINDFIFSADRTRFYAIELTASTGVSAQHTLAEYDQTGHRKRAIDLGEMAIGQTELALIQPSTLLWQYANRFYLIDLQRFTILDEVPVYSLSDYPDDQQDRATVDRKSQAWFNRKQEEIGKQFNIRKVDPVSFAILDGDTANADAYRVAVREVRDQQSQLELDWRESQYKAYALAQVKLVSSSFGYRSPNSFSEYLFGKYPDGRTAAFELGKAALRQSGVSFVPVNSNRAVASSQRNARYLDKADQAVTDKTASLRLTERLVTKYNTLRVNGLRNEVLLYHELELGEETAQFKSVLPLQVSDDLYLQSANGSAFVLKTGILYWFHP